ncbi:IclR family transcriptional regulator [Saccharomonospora glauca]|uniref:Transcriptional regulator n=1 Tax=Saccharomonospora glauca K62 TaxID=928724 RepID=I1CWP9_9PSEU|nr:helix-turn-helix domain-containing protein [Saccharomonospora glauca]EIE97123.1 transcriptional regulator [Saccharomonospora glauca K62]
MTRESSLTLDRGLALLQAVADAAGASATVTDLAKAVGMSRAAVYRLLVPLTERGLVWREGSRVRLGAGVLRLAEQMLPQLRASARPILRALADDVGATAHLSVAEGDQVHVVAVAEPTLTTFHVAYRLGSRHPVSRGAVGKALSLRPKGRGWAAAVGDPQPGVYGVAAPVRGIVGIRAALGVVSLVALDNATVGAQLVEAASALADALRD